MTEKLVVAITGRPGSGKTTLSNMLADELGFTVFEGSAILKTYAADEGLTLNTRASYNAYFRSQQSKRGMAWLADITLSSPQDRLVHCGLRTRPDFNRLQHVGALIVALDCPPEICLERIDLTNPKNPKTAEEYTEHLTLEESADEFGAHTGWCMDNASYRVDTSGSLAVAFADLSEIITTQA